MLSAGFVLLFRVSKSRAKSKSNKKEGRARRNQKQSIKTHLQFIIANEFSITG
jgi:hypothetical protein